MKTLDRLKLPTVTLCAAASVNLQATIGALRRCLQKVDFADCLFFTDKPHGLNSPDITTVRINRLTSSADYSRFILRELATHIRTEHVLVVQWDGFILDAEAWDHRFLEHDYIGAPWPQFIDGHDVGNGGFSFRSKRLLEACRNEPAFERPGPEDVLIGRTNRHLLEHKHGISFAPRHLADRFAFERSPPTGATFGFHGIFNMIDAVGADDFWNIYQSLDEYGAAARNATTLMKQLGAARASPFRRAKVMWDRWRR